MKKLLNKKTLFSIALAILLGVSTPYAFDILAYNGNIITSSGGGSGFVNPMPNGTFLQTIDKDDNVIPVAGYFSEVLAFGDYEFGNESFLASSDNFTTFFSSVTVGQESISMGIEDIANNKDFSYEVNNPNKEVTWRYETVLDDGTGMIVEHAFLADNADANNILINDKYVGFNDTASSIDYYRTEYGIVDATATNESGVKREFAILNGAEVPTLTIGSGGTITLHLLPQFESQLVTGGIAYASFETGYNTGAYAYQFGAGTTVPADATTGWSGAAIFTDGDAVGVNRTWLNIGTSASSAFRRIPTLSNSASYTITNDLTDRAFDADTVTTAELADVVATLIKDLGL